MAIVQQLTDAMGSHRGVSAADQLCVACVELFGVDAAAVSITVSGSNTGTLGVSSPQARIFDEVQFTLGEGPCLDAVTARDLVAVADLSLDAESRWTAYAPAMLAHHIRCVYSVPLVVAGAYVGALDLFRAQPGPLAEDVVTDASAAAELAGLPLLDLIAADGDSAADPDRPAWADWGALLRTEVNQATGMLMAQLDVSPVEALARLRAHAYATDRAASEVAHDILGAQLRLSLD